jgi:hypothetical protein
VKQRRPQHEVTFVAQCSGRRKREVGGGAVREGALWLVCVIFCGFSVCVLGPRDKNFCALAQRMVVGTIHLSLPTVGGAGGSDFRFRALKVERCDCGGRDVGSRANATKQRRCPPRR